MKKLHEYAEFFPAIEGADFDALCKSIKKNGLLNPITLVDDKILDGRNRARACEVVGVEPRYVNLNGTDAFQFVVAQNIERRHLNESQRAILALELEAQFAEQSRKKRESMDRVRGKSGRFTADSRTTGRKPERTSVSKAGKIMKVGSTTVQYAKKVAKEAPDLIPAIRQGKLTVNEAVKAIRARRVDSVFEKRQEKKNKRELVTHDRQVADFLAAAKLWQIAIAAASTAVVKFSPEARRFTLGRLSKIDKAIAELRKELEI